MRALLVCLCLVLGVLSVQAKYLATGKPYNVSYDHRAILFNGERTLLMSGSVHYPRSTPEMWPSILRQSKLSGVNLIQTYVFWNLHEPAPGNYNWEGYANLPQFLQYCQENELYVNLRIGPYVCAEWNYGGFPVWLKFLDGIVFRDYSPPFMSAMQSWMTYVVNFLKPYFASNGGPIILAQVENEYGWLEKEYGQPGAQYASWAAAMANNLGVGIPWIMCSQDNIYTVIDTCNGFYCDNWIAGHQAMFTNQPSLFTENWSGWFQDWSVAKPTRPAQDLAFSVARFIARGGTHNNYYMWHGGTNFARWSGGPFIVSSYDYDAPLDEYGLPNQPKYDHLTTLHSYLNRFGSIIVASDPVYVSYSSTSESHTYGTGANAVAFLSNIDTQSATNITYGGVTFTIPPWSVTIVYAGQVLYNTATLPYTEARPRVMKPINALGPNSGAIWSWAVEPIGVWGNPVYNPTPLEQVNLTRDATDYLWYVQSVTTTASSTVVTLNLTNTGDLVYLFINGTMYGTFKQGISGTIQWTFKVPAGTHTLNILSLTVGLINIEAHMEQWSRGLLGSVMWNNINITAPRSGWAHQVGLRGEAQGYWNGQSGSWHPNGTAVVNRPMTWYRAEFHLSKSDLDGASLALYINDLGKGFAWVNGNALGRFWNLVAGGNCTGCVYNASYSPNNGGCQVGCGQASQTYYHVPTSFLQEGENIVVLFTESGGSVAGVEIVQRE